MKKAWPHPAVLRRTLKMRHAEPLTGEEIRAGLARLEETAASLPCPIGIILGDPCRHSGDDELVDRLTDLD